MHMQDALCSPAVAVTMAAASAVTAGISIYRLRREAGRSLEGTDKKLPTMAVMSALVFAGQMINYTIPGTGASGHLCGGMLLSVLLGPWAGFLSMIAVLLIQCLFFADGGLMVLGANIWNMAFYGCFVGYFLFWKPLMNTRLKPRMKIILASVSGCVVSIQLGAFSVVLETSLSGITDLPFGTFVLLMQPIHLVIGLVEGLITAAVLLFLYEARPSLISGLSENRSTGKLSLKSTLITLFVLTVAVGGGLSLLASSHPDGLEWALFGNADSGYSENLGLNEEDYGTKSTVAEKAGEIQDKTAVLPDYALKSDRDDPAGTSLSGLLGIGLVMISVGGIALAGRKRKKK